jgi:hypothetical protein
MRNSSPERQNGSRSRSETLSPLSTTILNLRHEQYMYRYICIAGGETVGDLEAASLIGDGYAVPFVAVEAEFVL